MPKKWLVNDKKEKAREDEKQKKQQNKEKIQKQKEDQFWEDTDKQAIAKQQRKKEKEDKKSQEQQKKQEKKQLYEEEMSQYAKCKSEVKVKNVQITQPQLLKPLEKLEKEKELQKIEQLQINEEENKIDENKNSQSSAENSEGNYQTQLEENINHILREQEDEDKVYYNKIISAHGIDDAIKQLGPNEKMKHPEKKMRAAYLKYVDEQMPILKEEFPSFKRSKLLDILHKNANNLIVNTYYLVEEIG